MATNAQSIQFLLSQVRRAAGSLEDGTVTAYSAGTTNLKTIWLDRGKQTEAANPYTLDANGTAALFGDGLYRFVIKSASGTTVYDRDYISIKDVSTLAYDVADYASLAAAVAAIGSTPATLQYSSDQTVSSNLSIPSNIELVPINGAIISHGSYAITYAGSTSSWPSRQNFSGIGTVTLSNSDVTRPSWFGWATTASAATNVSAFHAAVAAAPVGSDLVTEPGLHYVTGTGTACLNITRNVNLVGKGTKIVADANTGADTSIIRVAVATDGNGGNGDVRGQVVSGVNAYVTLYGKHALFFDAGPSILGQIQPTVEHCTLAGAYGKALYFKGNVQFSNVHHNDITDGVEYYSTEPNTVDGCGDGHRIVFNTISGIKTGIVMKTLDGTYSHIIAFNAITARDGAVDIVNTWQVKILYNQIEQAPAGFNDSAYHSQIVVEGGAATDIVGNNLGGGSNVNFNISVIDGSYVKIKDNVMFLPAVANVSLTTGSSKCVCDDSNRYFGGSSPGVAIISDVGTNNIVERVTGKGSSLYQTGTFIPTIAGSTAAGTGTYTTQSGAYTRIGNRVFFEIQLFWSALTGATGTLEIHGLPIPLAATSPVATFSVYYTNLVVAAGKQLVAGASASGSVIALLASDPAGGAIAGLAVDTAGTVIVSGHYQVD